MRSFTVVPMTLIGVYDPVANVIETRQFQKADYDPHSAQRNTSIETATNFSFTTCPFQLPPPNFHFVARPNVGRENIRFYMIINIARPDCIIVIAAITAVVAICQGEDPAI